MKIKIFLYMYISILHMYLYSYTCVQVYFFAGVAVSILVHTMQCPGNIRHYGEILNWHRPFIRYLVISYWKLVCRLLWKLYQYLLIRTILLHTHWRTCVKVKGPKRVCWLLWKLYQYVLIRTILLRSKVKDIHNMLRGSKIYLD